MAPIYLPTNEPATRKSRGKKVALIQQLQDELVKKVEEERDKWKERAMLLYSGTMETFLKSYPYYVYFNLIRCP